MHDFERVKMANRIAAALLLFQFCLSITGCSSEGPTELKSVAGGFSVTAPVQLTEQEVTADTFGIKNVVHVFGGKSNEAEFFVGYLDYPNSVIKEHEASELIDIRRDGSVSSQHGRLMRESKITLEGHPGKEFVYDFASSNNEQLSAKVRIYLVGSRLYQVGVSASKYLLPMPVNESYLQSFKLLTK